jgi:hypothetical protein
MTAVIEPPVRDQGRTDPDPEQSVATPTVRRFFGRVRFWIVIAVIVLVVAGLSSLSTGASLDAQPLAADGTGTVGAKALVEVLRQQGVTVIVTDTLGATRDAVASASDTTIMLYDDSDYLSAAKLTELRGLADHIIVVHPSFAQLKALAPAVHLAGTADATMKADCDLPAVTKAGTVTAGGFGYRVDASATDATRCLGSGKGIYSLVRLPTDTGDITFLGTVNALTNQHIIEDGNAALALNLLGATPRLIWYLPTIDDVATVSGPPSIASASPAWVIPLSLLAFIVVIAAAVWRGRRFGPLVVERLPVTVRASETMEGRARLYEKSSARLRALDSLRIGALERLARTCGLPRTATTDDVIDAVVTATSRPVADIRALLIESVPRSDSELVRMSDELLLLERAVAIATRPA